MLDRRFLHLPRYPIVLELFMTPPILPVLAASWPITELHRYAVKGLSGDALSTVDLQSGRFPDDRRYALLKADREWKNGEWLHKENFLCAFSNPKLMASFQSAYDQGSLTIQDRVSGTVLLGPLAMPDERSQLAEFMSRKSGEALVCLSSEDFQFGNTSSGVKKRQDSRTIHIVNQATVDDFSKKIGVPLNASRFRPNIVLTGAPAWSEFDWIDKKLQCGDVKMTVLSKTVRCEGVSIDPTDPEHVLDIPGLLVEHFPEHGPYLGAYAAVDTPGEISLGDDFSLLN